jgi:hypothetical protein
LPARPAPPPAEARLLLKSLPGAAVRAVTGLTRIRLLLGSSGHAVSGGHAVSAAPPTEHQAAIPGEQRTAAQAACG